jgi:hypothetical protein
VVKAEGDFFFDSCYWNKSTQILRVTSFPYSRGRLLYIFQLYDESNNFKITLKTDFIFIHSFGNCLYSCDACFYNYKTCNIERCQNEYSFFRDKDETNITNCAPNNQTFKNYIYNDETNYFENAFIHAHFVL